MAVSILTAGGLIDVATLVRGGDHYQMVVPTNILAGKGRKTATASGTGEALVASATPCSMVEVQGLKANANPVTVGPSGVDGAPATRDGIALDPGERDYIWTDDVANVFVDVEIDGDGVSFVYYAPAS